MRRCVCCVHLQDLDGAHLNDMPRVGGSLPISMSESGLCTPDSTLCKAAIYHLDGG